MSKEIEIIVVQGVEGPSVYINGYRVSGSKPWGGGQVQYSFKAKKENIETALREQT